MMTNRRTLLSAGVALLGCAQAPPARPRPRLKGVNIAGLEFNSARLPGRLDHDYVAPNPAEIAYYRAAGARVLRIPFLWERLQPDLGGAFDAGYLRLLQRVVDRSGGMNVILDAHQYGRRRERGQAHIIGESSDVSSRHFSDFWRELATQFRAAPNIIFGLQNEPHDQRMDVLIRVQNEAIAAIRGAGATQLILASGNAWSGAHSWRSSGNAAAMVEIEDMGNNFAFDVHQYLDGDSSGRGSACVPGAGRRLRPFAEWARRNNRRGFLGEFGGGAGRDCLAELSSILDEIEGDGDVWLGWAYWAGGDWWPEDYPLGIRPASLNVPQDRPQMALLRRYFSS